MIHFPSAIIVWGGSSHYTDKCMLDESKRIDSTDQTVCSLDLEDWYVSSLDRHKKPNLACLRHACGVSLQNHLQEEGVRVRHERSRALADVPC
jgi:hypothetical protein